MPVDQYLSALTNCTIALAASAVGLIAYGTTHHAVVEARDVLAERGLPVDYLRVRALPLAGPIAIWGNDAHHLYVFSSHATVVVLLLGT